MASPSPNGDVGLSGTIKGAVLSLGDRRVTENAGGVSSKPPVVASPSFVVSAGDSVPGRALVGLEGHGRGSTTAQPVGPAFLVALNGRGTATGATGLRSGRFIAS